MKTQCPSCNQVWIIDADEQGQTIDCFYCKTQFKAAPYSGPVPKEPPPIPYKPSESALPVENIGCPGGIWYVLGAVVGIGGIIGGLFDEELGVIIAAVMFWLIATAVGGILNRLERIAHHTEKLREETKTSKTEIS